MRLVKNGRILKFGEPNKIVSKAPYSVTVSVENVFTRKNLMGDGIKVNESRGISDEDFIKGSGLDKFESNTLLKIVKANRLNDFDKRLVLSEAKHLKSEARKNELYKEITTVTTLGNLDSLYRYLGGEIYKEMTSPYLTHSRGGQLKSFYNLMDLEKTDVVSIGRYISPYEIFMNRLIEYEDLPKELLYEVENNIYTRFYYNKATYKTDLSVYPLIYSKREYAENIQKDLERLAAGEKCKNLNHALEVRTSYGVDAEAVNKYLKHRIAYITLHATHSFYDKRTGELLINLKSEEINNLYLKRADTILQEPKNDLGVELANYTKELLTDKLSLDDFRHKYIRMLRTAYNPDPNAFVLNEMVEIAIVQNIRYIIESLSYTRANKYIYSYYGRKKMVNKAFTYYENSLIYTAIAIMLCSTKVEVENKIKKYFKQSTLNDIKKKIGVLSDETSKYPEIKECLLEQFGDYIRDAEEYYF